MRLSVEATSSFALSDRKSADDRVAIQMGRLLLREGDCHLHPQYHSPMSFPEMTAGPETAASAEFGIIMTPNRARDRSITGSERGPLPPVVFPQKHALERSLRSD